VADLSFKCWHVAVNCDHPGHRKVDPMSNDYETVEPELTRAEYRAELRADGWIFHRNGKATCPDCARTQNTPE
jgi:hypothetical protein